MSRRNTYAPDRVSVDIDTGMLDTYAPRFPQVEKSRTSEILFPYIFGAVKADRNTCNRRTL